MSELEELKAENEIILNRLTQYEEDADVQVCLFSDVKLLEQENAELKAKIKKYAAINEQETKYYAELKVENEQLKQQLAEIGKSWGEIQRMREEKENLIEQLVIYNQFENSYNKYRQTLQEIKAIAEDAMAKQQEYKKDFEQILDLITKAEEE